MEPITEPATLTERQLLWLEKNIPPFKRAWRQVKASDEHAARVRAKVEGNGGVSVS